VVRLGFLVLFFILKAQGAWAGNLLAPFSTDSADVLPPGVRNFRVQFLTSETHTKFDEKGKFVGLGSSLNQNVTWDDLLQGVPAGFEQKSNEAYLKHNHKNIQKKKLSLSTKVGETFGDVHVRVTATVPVFAYGVSKSWTTALAVPVIYSQINVVTGFVAAPPLRKTLDAMVADGKPNKAREVARKTARAVENKMSSQGYDAHFSRENTEIGDISWVNKFQVHKTPVFALVVQPMVTFPTGHRANVHDPFAIGSGDGQFDLGLRGVMDIYLKKRVTLTAAVGYLAQLPDTQAFRIPESADQKTSSDVDPKTSRDLGDVMSSQLGLQFQLGSGFAASSFYSFQYKEADRFSGRAPGIDQQRYNFLETETEQTMHATRLGVSYSTISLYQQGRFAVPLQVGLGYSEVLTGRNVANSDLTSFEFAMFF